MAIATTTILAAAALGVAAYSAYEGYEARKDARANAERAFEQGEKARQEQRAANAQQQAAERRAQIREERVRRAKLLQAGENTGVGASSGMMGAIGGLATTLASNLGINAGRAMTGDAISNYQQQASWFNMQADNDMNRAQNMKELFSLSTQAFSASGGWKNFSS